MTEENATPTDTVEDDQTVIETPPEEEAGETIETEETPGDEAGETEATPTVESLTAELADEKKAREKADNRAGYLERTSNREIIPKSGTPPAEQPGVTAKPVETDFENYTDFVEKLTDWKADQRESTNREQRIKTGQQERARDFSGKLVEGTTKYKDFADVVYNPQNLDINDSNQQAVIDALQGSERTADILYHLGSNPEEGREFVYNSVHNPLAAARQIGKLEASIPKGPPQKTTTNAPNANKKVGGGETSIGKGDDSKLSTEAWIAKKNAEEFG